MLEQQRVRHILQRRLDLAQAKNPSFSLRSYAKFLNMHPTTLTEFLRGKRDIGHDKALSALARINVPKDIAADICRHEPAADFQEGWHAIDHSEMRDSDEYRCISEWLHFAVFCYLECEEEFPGVDTLAQRFGCSATEILDSLDLLQRLHLVRREADGHWCKTEHKLSSSDNISSTALMAAHTAALSMAQEKLNSLPLEERDFLSLTFAMDRSAMEAVKALNRRYLNELHALASASNKTDVYMCSLQMFPLTRAEENT